MTNLSKQIADAMIARLALSYQSSMNTIAAAYGIAPETVVFAQGNSQFFRGYFTIDDLEENVTSLVYPVVMLYGRGASNLRETKPAKFAGTVDMGMDIIHGFPLEEMPDGIQNDYESILDATLDVLVDVFNTGVTFPMPISYGGKLDDTGRGPRRLSDREQEFTRLQRFAFQFYTRK